MLVLFVRVIILYFLVFFVIRLTGKRQISELQPFDLVVTLLIADMASIPATNTGIPLIYGIVPILALFLLQQLISFLCLKSEGLRCAVCGHSVIMIAKGVVQESGLRETRYTVTDLMEQLRSKDVFVLADVEYAILETNGELSVLLKGEQQTPTYSAMSLPPPPAAPAFILVQDGNIHLDSLRESGFDKNWLDEKLRRCSCSDASEVFFALLGPDGKLHVQKKGEFGGRPVFIDTKGGAA